MGYGMGVLKGMGITFRHMIETYTIGFKLQPSAAGDLPAPTGVAGGMPTVTGGMQTIQYPEEKLPVPERFRYLPFLLYDEEQGHERAHFDGVRCTACGICAKVCPPQCIWIVRSDDPETGRPIPEPAEFYIDIDICMNCGFCMEFCPFDAIKMDHDYELASYDRTTVHIHDHERLIKPFSYWKSIAPTTATEEAEARGGWEHIDVIKERKKREAAAARAAAAAQPAAAPAPQASTAAETPAAADVAAPVAEAVADAPAPVVDEAEEERKKAERLAKREAALARKKAKQEGGDN